MLENENNNNIETLIVLLLRAWPVHNLRIFEAETISMIFVTTTFKPELFFIIIVNLKLSRAIYI